MRATGRGACLALLIHLFAAPGVFAEDIWGPGNDVSDVHGPADLQAPKEAPPSVHAPDTPNWRKLCKAHFMSGGLRDYLKRQKKLRLALQDGSIDSTECRRQWTAYARTQKTASEECVKTYPEYAGREGPYANPEDADAVCR